MLYVSDVFVIFCFKQKTAYEMRISDWSSDVCSSDLRIVTELFNAFIREPNLLSPDYQYEGESDSGFKREDKNKSSVDVAGVQARKVADYISSEERRVGKEWFSTCRTRWPPYH